MNNVELNHIKGMLDTLCLCEINNPSMWCTWFCYEYTMAVKVCSIEYLYMVNYTDTSKGKIDVSTTGDNSDESITNSEATVSIHDFERYILFTIFVCVCVSLACQPLSKRRVWFKPTS